MMGGDVDNPYQMQENIKFNNMFVCADSQNDQKEQIETIEKDPDTHV